MVVGWERSVKWISLAPRRSWSWRRFSAGPRSRNSAPRTFAYQSRVRSRSLIWMLTWWTSFGLNMGSTSGGRMIVRPVGARQAPCERRASIASGCSRNTSGSEGLEEPRVSHMLRRTAEGDSSEGRPAPKESITPWILRPASALRSSVAFIMTADALNFRATALGKVECYDRADFRGFSCRTSGDRRASGDRRGQTTRGRAFCPDPPPSNRLLEDRVDLDLVAVGQAVRLVGHAHDGHELAQHLVRHAVPPCRDGVRGDAVVAAVRGAHREVEHLLGEGVENARRHHRFEGLPGAAQGRRVDGDRLPEVGDEVGLSRGHDVVVDGAHLGGRVSVLDELLAGHGRAP